MRKCQYCGGVIPEGSYECPHCGAPTDGGRIPATIEELQQWYASMGLPPEHVTRFFIGKDVKEPRAFGIYREPNGTCVVYKNKNDGSRAVRYRGTDEAHAVNELFQRLKGEIANQKAGIAMSGGRRNNIPPNGGGRQYAVPPTPPRRTKKGPPIGLIIGVIVVVLIIGFALSDSGSSGSGGYYPDTGYYQYDGGYYYSQGDDWYSYNRSSGWSEVTAPDDLADNYGDYYVGYDWNSDFRGVSDFSNSGYYDNSYDYSSSDSYGSGGGSWDNDDSSDSGWSWDWGDSDDSYWDSSDSWDSGDSDWDSDWKK